MAAGGSLTLASPNTSGECILDNDRTSAAAARVGVQPIAPDRADSEFFVENETLSARTGSPYNWGNGRQQPTSMIMARIDGRGAVERMRMVQIGVADAIYDVLSKEAFLNKLIIPLNENLELEERLVESSTVSWIKHWLGSGGLSSNADHFSRSLSCGMLTTALLAGLLLYLIEDRVLENLIPNKIDWQAGFGGWILIISYKGRIPNICKQHVVSDWEWQKNTALLELEQRNQLLQHQLKEAGGEVMEARSVAQHNKEQLEEALKKRNNELYLIGRAGTMRTRLIQQKQVIARFHIYIICFLSWQRFSRYCRKRKILKKLELLWDRHMLTKRFEGFLQGYLSIKHRRKMKDKGFRHWIKKSTAQHFHIWLAHIRGNHELKENVKGFVRTRAHCRLKVAFRGWRESYLTEGWKQMQRKRASLVWSFRQLRKAWHEWDQHVVLAKDRNCYVEDLRFRRLAGDCFSRWWRYIQVKLQPGQGLLSIKMMRSISHQSAFNIWNHKISVSLVVRERLMCFVKHRTWKMQQLIVTKWHQLVWRTRYLRSVEKVLLRKSMFWSKKRSFRELKQRWIKMRVFQRRQTLCSLRTRLTSFGKWKARIQHLIAVKRRVLQIQRRRRRRWQEKLFSFWVVYTAKSRKFTIAKEAIDLSKRVKWLESDLDVAEQARHRLHQSILEFQNDKTKVIRSAQEAIFRTPLCKTGFLDVELRWRTPALEWVPPSCAGHTTVSLPGKHGSYCSRIVLFGGYNGEKCFNHVLVFDTDEMHWYAPTLTAAKGSVIPRALLTHTACAFGKNKMILFGGYDGAKEFSELSVLEISEDGLTCEWSQPQLMGGAKVGSVCQHTSCLFEDGPCMVVYGGYCSEVGLLNEVWILDLRRLHWTCPECFGTPPVPRRGHGAAMVGKKMFIFGGYDGREHLADLHVLDIKTMTWECIHYDQGPSARRQHSVTVIGQHLVVYGGYDGKQYLGDLFSFDTIRRSWKQWPDQETSLHLEEIWHGGQVHGRSMHTMAEAGQRLVIFGGVNEWGALQEMIFVENAAAVDNLQLQCSLFEELQEVTDLQAQVTECKKTMAENFIKLAGTQKTEEHLRSVLQVESEKKKKAVQGYRVLVRKLRKARAVSDPPAQTRNK